MKLLKILGEEWIKRQKEHFQWVYQQKYDLESPEEIRDNLSAPRPNLKLKPLSGILILHNRIEEACYEIVCGSEIKNVRKLYQEGAEAFLGTLKAWNFPQIEVELRMLTPSAAQDLEKFQNAQIEKDPDDRRFYKAKYTKTEIPTELSLRMEKALFASVLSDNWDLVHELSNSYPSPSQVNRPLEFDTMLVILTIILGRGEVAQACMKNEPPGYAVDFPPMRREFLHGLINNDISLIFEGLRKTNTRFKGMWNVKKYRKMWDNQPKWRQYHDSWESFWKQTRKDLVGMHWLMSEYATCCCKLAVHIGMTELLDDPKMFSEWVPFKLVED